MTLPEILQEASDLDKQARALKKDCLKLAWYMRGLSYSEAMHLSYEEREIVGEIIKENLDTTKSSKLPFF